MNKRVDILSISRGDGSVSVGHRVAKKVPDNHEIREFTTEDAAFDHLRRTLALSCDRMVLTFDRSEDSLQALHWMVTGFMQYVINSYSTKSRAYREAYALYTDVYGQIAEQCRMSGKSAPAMRFPEPCKSGA